MALTSSPQNLVCQSKVNIQENVLLVLLGREQFQGEKKLKQGFRFTLVRKCAEARLRRTRHIGKEEQEERQENYENSALLTTPASTHALGSVLEGSSIATTKFVLMPVVDKTPFLSAVLYTYMHATMSTEAPTQLKGKHRARLTGHAYHPSGMV